VFLQAWFFPPRRLKVRHNFAALRRLFSECCGYGSFFLFGEDMRQNLKGGQVERQSKALSLRPLAFYVAN